MNPSRFLMVLILCPIFFVAALIVNYPGLDAPMMYDSRNLIEEQRVVFDTHGLKGAVSVFPQRPLPMLTFYLNYLAGGMEPAWFRLANVVMLTATGVTVAILVELILGCAAGPRGTGPVNSRFVAAFLGLLFVVHPIQIYVTLYIWQRIALMACLFYYAALGVYLAVRMDLLRHQAVGYAACVVLFPAAVLSKENSFTLPLVLLIAEIALFRQPWKALAARAAVFCGVLIACIGLVSVLQHPHGKETLGAGVMETLTIYYQESGLTPVSVLLTQCRVLFRYLAMILVPLPSSLLLTNPQIVARSIFDPSGTLFAVLGAAAVIVLGIFLLKKRPAAGFGIVFFMVNLVPEAVLVPQYSFFAYRAVLPMLGVLLVVADVASLVANALASKPKLRLIRAVLVALAVAGLLFAAGVTSIRATVWSDGIRFWREAVDNFPPLDGRVERLPALQALNNLGLALMKHGRYLEAAQTYESVLKLEPRDPRKRILLAAAYAELGKAADAEALFKEALAMNPEYVSGLAQYAVFLMARQREAEAVEHLRKAAALAPTNPVVKSLLNKAEQGAQSRTGDTK